MVIWSNGAPSLASVVNGRNIMPHYRYSLGEMVPQLWCLVASRRNVVSYHWEMIVFSNTYLAVSNSHTAPYGDVMVGTVQAPSGRDYIKDCQVLKCSAFQFPAPIATLQSMAPSPWLSIKKLCMQAFSLHGKFAATGCCHHTTSRSLGTFFLTNKPRTKTK